MAFSDYVDIEILKCVEEGTYIANHKGEVHNYEIFIIVGPWLMKLYITPPSILTLVTWVPQSKLAFGQTPHV